MHEYDVHIRTTVLRYDYTTSGTVGTLLGVSLALAGAYNILKLSTVSTMTLK